MNAFRVFDNVTVKSSPLPDPQAGGTRLGDILDEFYRRSRSETALEVVRPSTVSREPDTVAVVEAFAKAIVEAERLRSAAMSDAERLRCESRTEAERENTRRAELTLKADHQRFQLVVSFAALMVLVGAILALLGKDAIGSNLMSASLGLLLGMQIRKPKEG